ncbi:MAG TPA: DUF222 domain-containing protein [Trebonia sp.]
MDSSYSRRPGPPPEHLTDPDPEWTEYLAWKEREVAAGRDPDTEPWPPAMEEPSDPGAEVPARFWQGEAADELPPGPLLAGLTEDAVLGLECLSDNELIGVLHATRRQVAREQYKQVLVTAEFGRRRQAAFRDALARGVPAGCAPGGFPGEELAIELMVTRAEAGHLIDDAIDLTARLPRTLAGMAAGLIDADRAGWIAFYTRSLTPADTARADELLAEAGPDLRAEQLSSKAAALEKKLSPRRSPPARNTPSAAGSGSRRAGRHRATPAWPGGNSMPPTCLPRRRSSTRSPPSSAPPVCSTARSTGSAPWP